MNRVLIGEPFRTVTELRSPPVNTGPRESYSRGPLVFRQAGQGVSTASQQDASGESVGASADRAPMGLPPGPFGQNLSVSLAERPRQLTLRSGSGCDRNPRSVG